jgi:hypothetical protein
VQFGFQFISAAARDNLRRLGPMFYRRPLDWLNFFHTDVRGGLGPYVGGVPADARLDAALI